MKRTLWQFFSLAALLPLLSLSGCSTSSVTMEVLKPADITLPKDIQTIALMNRFRPEKGKGFLNVLEGALSGENVGTDRNGAEASLVGLTNTLASSPRYRVIRPRTELQGWGRASFPDPLAPDLVQQICQDYNAQALVTIEAFDSDAGRSCERRTRTRKVDGEEITEIFFEAEEWVDVEVGWRLYGASNGKLLDEFKMYQRVDYDAEGGTEDAAFRNLPDSDFIIADLGAITGEAYSLRIAPIYVNVSRSYYSGGTTALKLGRDDVRRNDWAAANEHWDMALTNEKEKIRGRALYNKALLAEVEGDLIRAHELALESYEKYGDKRGLRYAELLRARIHDVDRLEQQMQGAPQ